MTELIPTTTASGSTGNSRIDSTSSMRCNRRRGRRKDCCTGRMYLVPMLQVVVVVVSFVLSNVSSFCYCFNSIKNSYGSRSTGASTRTSTTISISNSAIRNNKHQQQITSKNIILYSSINDDNDYMASLQRRIQQITEKESIIPVVIMDTIVPRQVLKLQIAYNDDPQFYVLLMKLITSDTASLPSFGMVGQARILQGSSGQYLPLRNGVVVEIMNVNDENDPIVVPDNDDDSAIIGYSTKNTPSGLLPTLNIILRATTKRFRYIGPAVQSTDGEWNEGIVQYLDSQTEEYNEKQNSDTKSNYIVAIQRCKELILPNGNMPDNKSLIDTWIMLARTNEQFNGQIDQILNDIGPIPLSTSNLSPTDVSFWIGALINPLSGLGVAMEIRPLLLMSNNSYERINIAISAIYNSIRHMDGTKRLF